MNALFGGTPHSMLFRSVREKLSLCYYCASSYDYIKGVMLVDSGVEAAKADEAQAEILRQLDLLRQGAFTDEDLEAARRSVLNQFQEVDDLQSSQDGWYLRQSVSTRFTSPEESAAALAAVTRDEVCARRPAGASDMRVSAAIRERGRGLMEVIRSERTGEECVRIDHPLRPADFRLAQEGVPVGLRGVRHPVRLHRHSVHHRTGAGHRGRRHRPLSGAQAV